jgi:hypothetical protein
MSSIGPSEIAIIVACLCVGVIVLAGVGVGAYLLGKRAAAKDEPVE